LRKVVPDSNLGRRSNTNGTDLMTLIFAVVSSVVEQVTLGLVYNALLP
jgi:hypothetical protein